MRIFKIIAQSKIPVEFDGIPLSGELINMLRSLDTTYSLTEEEIKWVLKSFNFLVTLNTQPRWSIVEGQFNQLFNWARETGVFLPLTDSQDDMLKVRAYFVQKRIEEVFSQKPWAVSLLKEQSEQTINKIMELEQVLDNGLTQKELVWILSSKAFEDNDCDLIIRMYRSIGEELTYQPLQLARSKAIEMNVEHGKIELSRMLSNTGLKTVDLSGGWKAIWVDPNKESLIDENASELELDDLAYETDIERAITGVKLDHSDRVISIRDPNNVPRASIEIYPNSSETYFDLDVYEIVGTPEGKNKIKELREILKQDGSDMISIDDPIEVSDINEFVQTVNNAEIVMPSISLTIGGSWQAGINSKDGYKQALDWIYDCAWGGANYYEHIAKRGFDALAEYAKQRGELHQLTEARSEFDDEAFDMWTEYESSSETFKWTEHQSPESSDEEFNEDGVFNQEAFDVAKAKYEEELEKLQDNFEPYRFSNYVYKTLESLQAYYDAETTKEEKIKQKKEQIVLEKERKKQQEERRRLEEQKHQEFEKQVEDYGKKFQVNLDNSFLEDNIPEDDDLLTDFNINWDKPD